MKGWKKKQIIKKKVTLEMSEFCKIKGKRILHKPSAQAGDVVFCSNINSVNSESICMCTRIEKLRKCMTGAESKMSYRRVRISRSEVRIINMAQMVYIEMW